jgi:hypothetical protein
MDLTAASHDVRAMMMSRRGLRLDETKQEKKEQQRRSHCIEDNQTTKPIYLDYSTMVKTQLIVLAAVASVATAFAPMQMSVSVRYNT